jgi:O-antigen/teichoic acid export membrane protein
VSGRAGLRRPDAGIVILGASVAAGALNYLYALGMAALLEPAEYSRFSSGNALLLVAGTVANAAVPWLLAREIARDPEHVAAGTVRFASRANLVLGGVAALLVVALSVGSADVWMLLWLGGSALSFFVASTGMGWAQGHQRFGLLSVLILAEVALKAAVGAVLVLAGFGASGAFAGATVGAVVIALAMAGPMRGDRAGRGVRFPRELVKAAVGMAGVQALVSALAVVDVVYVTILLGTSPDVASYQLAATLSRVPLFVAGALATAAFPLLARTPGDRVLLTRQTTGLTVLLIPILLVIATVPSSLLGVVVSDEYAATGGFLAVTAATGCAWAFVTLQTTALRADGRFGRCVGPLALGGVVSLVGMTLGGVVADVEGLAVGALAGGLVSVAALAVAMRRLWPASVEIRLAPLAVFVPFALALVALHGNAVAWTAVAVVLGLYAARVWLAGSAVPRSLRAVATA